MTASVLSTLAVLGLMAGLFAFGALTRPLPDTSGQFDRNGETESDGWRLVESIPATVPYALVVGDDQILVFTSAPDPDEAAPSGLQVWRSPDAVAWEPMGTVIEQGFAVDSITSTSLGLVAFGFDEHQEASRIWLSADGLRWLPLLDGLTVESRDIRPVAKGATTSELDMAIGTDARVVQYERTEGRDVALVSREPDFSHPFSVEAFEIWATTPQ